MLKHFFLSIAFVTSCSWASTPPGADRAVHIDAASDSTAQESFEKMLRQSSTERQQELVIAVLKLNMEGVKSATELASRPDLQTLSIVRIKDRVAGMSADQIIGLADHTSDLKVEVQSK